MSVLLAGLAFDAIPQAFAQDLRRPDPARDFPLPFEARQSKLFYLKRESFQPYVGGAFRLRAGARSVEAKLTEVRDCTPAPGAEKITKRSRPTDCFALVFETSETLTDLTTIYDVEHGALGSFALFLTRRDGPGGTYFYEAVFNRAL